MAKAKAKGSAKRPSGKMTYDRKAKAKGSAKSLRQKDKAKAKGSARRPSGKMTYDRKAKAKGSAKSLRQKDKAEAKGQGKGEKPKQEEGQPHDFHDDIRWEVAEEVSLKSRHRELLESVLQSGVTTNWGQLQMQMGFDAGAEFALKHAKSFADKLAQEKSKGKRWTEFDYQLEWALFLNDVWHSLPPCTYSMAEAADRRRNCVL